MSDNPLRNLPAVNDILDAGPLRALRHWIAFATDSPDGAAGGLWIVDERGFPRQLFYASAQNHHHRTTNRRQSSLGGVTQQASSAERQQLFGLAQAG